MYNSRDIRDLRPDVRKNVEIFLELCEKKGLNVLVFGTVRDNEQQIEYYNNGASLATVPSFHACGSGLAFDVCKNVKGHEFDDPDFFDACAEIGKRMGFEWGGDWTSFVDKPHFQWSEHGRYNSADIIDGRIPEEMPLYDYSEEEDEPTKPVVPTDSDYEYDLVNGMHIVSTPIENFKIAMWDDVKKTVRIKNYFNAGFFGNYKEKGDTFTLPTGPIVADILSESPLSEYTEFYLRERGKIENGKAIVPSHDGAKKSTLLLKDGNAWVEQVSKVPDGVEYAICGLPVIIDKNDVSWSTYVLPEGWDATPVYGTWHSLVGLKAGEDRVYYIGMETFTKNCISSSEIYKKLIVQGFTDVLLLDGGGSFVLDVEGKNVAVTAENRVINSVGLFGA